MPTRRDFLLAATAAAAFPRLPGLQSAAARSTLDIHRAPDSVVVQSSGPDRHLRRTTGGRWEEADIIVTLSPVDGATRVQLTAPSAPVRRVRLRWNGRLDEVRLVLGDAWERGYGDLEWRGFVPDRVMPWYVATSDGRITHAYGVRTGASGLCF